MLVFLIVVILRNSTCPSLSVSSCEFGAGLFPKPSRIRTDDWWDCTHSTSLVDRRHHVSYFEFNGRRIGPVERQPGRAKAVGRDWSEIRLEPCVTASTIVWHTAKSYNHGADPPPAFTQTTFDSVRLSAWLINSTHPGTTHDGRRGHRQPQDADQHRGRQAATCRG